MIPLLLIPGMMCDARLYSCQMATFSAQRPIHSVPLSGHDSVQSLAQEILANAPEQFAMLGLSMGGIVAMEVMSQQPERVKGLALLDTNPLAEKDEVKERRGPQMEKVKAGFLAEVMTSDMIPNYLADEHNGPDILDLCLDMALNVGADNFINQSLALMHRPDQCSTLKQVDVPTLILCGEQDQLCPLERHQLMAELIPHAEFVTVPNAGHLPTLEQPGLTNAAIARWLQRI